jgi:L-histidine N-alpha-methyltransferase
MHLEALRATRRYAGPAVSGASLPAERMHTENSYKWRHEDFAALLAAAGFSAPRHWCDARGWFAVFAAQA